MYEEELKNFKFNDTKLLEYNATTKTDYEKVNIELRINSESFPDEKPNPKFDEEIKVAKVRIKRIKDYIKSWNNSELFKELTGDTDFDAKEMLEILDKYVNVLFL